MTTTPRERVLDELLAHLRSVRPGERVAVAIDGVDGAGKTRLAAELVELSRHRPGRRLVPVSIDGFHHPKAVRQQAGTGPEGFYRGSYRYDVFRSLVIDRLRAGQPLVRAVWDVEADAPVPPVEVVVPPDGVVVVDGIFLQRPELAGAWDVAVWVDVPFAVSVPRGNARFPGEHDPDPEAPGNARYVGGQRLYIDEVDPRRSADLVLDNTDLAHPRLVRPGDPA